jgi:hypothetical protein
VKCPACGHTFSTPAKDRPLSFVGQQDTSTMNDAEMRRYYHLTAPSADCAFVVSHFPDLASEMPVSPTASDARRFFAIARDRLATHLRVNTEADFWAFVARQDDWYRAGRPPDTSRDEDGCTQSKGLVP